RGWVHLEGGMSSSVDRPASAPTFLAPVRRFLDGIARGTEGHPVFPRRLPIRARIALFGAAVVALTVVIFSVLVYVIVYGSLVRQQDRTLQIAGDRAWSVLESGGRVVPGRNFFPPDLNNSSEPFVEIFDSQGTPTISGAIINGVNPELPSNALE